MILEEIAAKVHATQHLMDLDYYIRVDGQPYTGGPAGTEQEMLDRLASGWHPVREWERTAGTEAGGAYIFTGYGRIDGGFLAYNAGYAEPEGWDCDSTTWVAVRHAATEAEARAAAETDRWDEVELHIVGI